MAGSKRVDDFLVALDKAQAVLAKERPSFSTPSKSIGITNYPDLGNTVTPEYSSTENAIQNIETLDSIISNIASGVDVARKIPWGQMLTKATNVVGKLPLGQTLIKAPSVISQVGKVAEPVQMTLWSADAARTMFDPEYRDQSKVGIEQLLDKDKASPTKAALEAMSAIFARPVGTISGLLDASSRASLDQINQDFKGASLDRQARDRADKEAVPEITADTIRRDRALKYFNR